MKTIKDFYIFKHGIEGEQYFQGHGIAFTNWEDCATGVGNSESEALDDALEQLGQSGWDVDALEKDPAFLVVRKDQIFDQADPFLEKMHAESEDCDLHVYVSIDVSSEE